MTSPAGSSMVSVTPRSMMNGTSWMTSTPHGLDYSTFSSGVGHIRPRPVLQSFEVSKAISMDTNKQNVHLKETWRKVKFMSY